MDGVDLLSAFDFSAIEDMDPSVADGYRVIYDREVPFELRVQVRGTPPARVCQRRALLAAAAAAANPPPPPALPPARAAQESADSPQQVGTLEATKVKILLLGEDSNPQSLRVELASEGDLFFHYMHVCNEDAFMKIQEQQKLMVEFQDYPNVLIRMLNSCIKEPHSHLAVFVMQADGHARLDFIQNMEYKFVELLSCNFARSPEDVVQHQITYRYNAMKSRLALMQARLQDVNNLVKIKNPSLLLQLQKNPSLAYGSGNQSGGGASRR